MTLQYRDVERDRIVWCDYQVDGEIVKSPVDIDELPAGCLSVGLKEPPVIDGSCAFAKGHNSPVTTRSLDLTPSVAARWISPSVRCRWHSYVTGNDELLRLDNKPEWVNGY